MFTSLYDIMKSVVIYARDRTVGGYILFNPNKHDHLCSFLTVYEVNSAA